MPLITYDNSAFGQNTGGTGVSFPFTVATNPYMILLLATFQKSSVTTFPSNVRYGGVSLSVLTNNSGPATNFGEMQIWTLQNPPTGTNNLTLSTGFDGTLVYHAIFSYYNVSGIDSFLNPVSQNTIISSFPSASFTPLGNNTLTWGVITGEETGGPNFQIVTPPTNNFSQTIADSIIIGAGDYGVQASPTSNSASYGRNPGSGYGNIGFVALSPLSPPGGSFLRNLM